MKNEEACHLSKRGLLDTQRFEFVVRLHVADEASLINSNTLQDNVGISIVFGFEKSAQD